jgi:hypothetical protein
LLAHLLTSWLLQGVAAVVVVLVVVVAQVVIVLLPALLAVAQAQNLNLD